MNKKSNIFERISQLAEIKGIKNVPELAVFMGYDNPEKLYRLKRSPDAKPSFEIVADFTNKFEDLNVRWFITGIGEPILAENYANTPALNDVLAEPVPIYLHLPAGEKRGNSKKGLSPTLSPTANYEAKEVFLTPKIITVDHGGRDNILYVPVKASAGYLKGFNDTHFIETLPSFHLPGLTNSTYRAFEVDGDSMYPTLENKEMVIGQWVEKLDYIREDRVHIIVTKSEGVLVKRLLNRVDKYGYIIAKSDAVNDRNLYPNIEIHPADVLELWYGVWHGGFNFKAPGDLWKRQNNIEADVTEIMRRLNQAGI